MGGAFLASDALLSLHWQGEVSRRDGGVALYCKRFFSVIANAFFVTWERSAAISTVCRRRTKDCFVTPLLSGDGKRKVCRWRDRRTFAGDNGRYSFALPEKPLRCSAPPPLAGEAWRVLASEARQSQPYADGGQKIASSLRSSRVTGRERFADDETEERLRVIMGGIRLLYLRNPSGAPHHLPLQERLEESLRAKRGNLNRMQTADKRLLRHSAPLGWRGEGRSSRVMPS